MLNLTLIAGTADPTLLYDAYRDLSQRYDQAGEQLDQIKAQLDALDEDQADEREHLLAEIDRLDNGHSVLLGWVSAVYAAYQFALRGTDTPWIDRAVRSSVHFIAPPAAVQPLTAVAARRTQVQR